MAGSRLARRLEQADRAYGQYLRSLSDKELEALCERADASLTGEERQRIQKALAAMTNAELDAAVDGAPWAMARYRALCEEMAKS